MSPSDARRESSTDGHLSAELNIAGIARDYWELILQRNPTWASDLGDYRYNDQLTDHSPAARAAYYESIESLNSRLLAVPEAQVSGQPAVTLEVLRWVLNTELMARRFVDEEWTVNPLHGPVTTLTELSDRQPLFPDDNLDRLLSRFDKVPELLDWVEYHLRNGVSKGTTAPAIGPERLSAQIRRMLRVPAADSAFMPTNAPEQLSATECDRIRSILASRIEAVVYPALHKHAQFLQEEYLPAARQQPGLCYMPGGGEYYQYLIHQYTGVSDSADAIHQMGRDELSRIHEEMIGIASRTENTTDLRAFVARLKQRTDQYLPDRDSLLAFNRELTARATQALPGHFSVLPNRPCEVRAIESFREADAPSGYYCHAPDDGSRPAYYYVNTYRPDHRPLYNMEALAFHEAVPGHHLQIAIAQDLTDIPDFRRHTGQTAFIEGWALYSERLSDEMGLYSSEITRFGMLNYQAWRAARLVLDTGIHHLGWTRERAIRELLDNTAHSEPEAVIEVDRYICMPGQALAYMIGRIHIDGLRTRAKERLGSRFNIKDFHRTVLENGAVPLKSLSSLVDRWLASAA